MIKALRALLLVLALAVCAFAGDLSVGDGDGNQGSGGREAIMQTGFRDGEMSGGAKPET